jgi:hypothetical protein
MKSTEIPSKLSERPGQRARLQFACLFPDPGEYATQLNLFPGNNAHAPWGTEGQFQLNVGLYSQSMNVGNLESPLVDASGNIRLQLDSALSTGSQISGGIALIDLDHESTIPVEIYLSHIHRKSQVYIAYPALSFAGDQLYPTVHTHQLENTLFWPGISCSKEVQPGVVVVNPYRSIMSFQVHLIRGDGSREHAEVIQIAPRSSGIYLLESLFPCEDLLASSGEMRASLCVSAQYKLVAYMMLRDRAAGVITSIDHLHTYCLY